MDDSVESTINSYATRCFRDTADRDYIHARLAYRSTLSPQFRWSALHALEKYAKCILLLNRIVGCEFKHVVTPIISKAKSDGGIDIQLSQESNDFISRLESGAASRYLETSWYTISGDLQRLDRAVVEIRRFCQILHFQVTTSSGETLDLFSRKLEALKTLPDHPLKNIQLNGGWLEKVMDNSSHPARAGLVWGNPFFGCSDEIDLPTWDYYASENSPFDLHPEVIQDLQKLIFVPSAQKKRAVPKRP